MADRRKLNQVWRGKNPYGEKFIFGRVGSGQNELIVTLDYCGKDANNQDRCLAKRSSQVGTLWRKIDDAKGKA